MNRNNWITNGTFKAASCYASYYINNDCTGISEEEKAEADRILKEATKGLKWASVVDIAENPDYTEEFQGLSIYTFIYKTVEKHENGIHYYTGFPLENKEELLPWQKQGLSYTASGYGPKIPTSKMVLFGNRWRRVYCMIYGNSGSCYFIVHGEEIFIDDCNLQKEGR